MRPLPAMNLTMDLRQAFRVLRKNPAFTAIAVSLTALALLAPVAASLATDVLVPVVAVAELLVYRRGLRPQPKREQRRVLLALDEANSIDDLSQPGFGLHPLAGNFRGYWSIVITRNWRITFRIEGNNIVEVDFIDYH